MASGDSNIPRGSISRHRAAAIRRKNPAVSEYHHRCETAASGVGQNKSSEGRLTYDGGFVKKMVAELCGQPPDIAMGRKVNKLKEMFEKGPQDSSNGNWSKDAHAEHHVAPIKPKKLELREGAEITNNVRPTPPVKFPVKLSNDSPRSQASDSPRSKASDSPRSKVSDSPRSKVSDSPRSKAADSPRSKVSDSPRSKVANSPRSKVADSSNTPELRPKPNLKKVLKIEQKVLSGDNKRQESTENLSNSAANSRTVTSPVHDNYCFKELKQFAQDNAKDSSSALRKSRDRKPSSPVYGNGNVSDLQTPPSDGTKTVAKKFGFFGLLKGPDPPKKVLIKDQNQQTADVSSGISNVENSSESNDRTDSGKNLGEQCQSENLNDSSFNISDGDGLLYEDTSDYPAVSECEQRTRDLNIAGNTQPSVDDDEIYENVLTSRKILPSNDSTLTSGVCCEEAFEDNLTNSGDNYYVASSSDNYYKDYENNDEDDNAIGWGSDFSSEDSFDDSDWLVVCGEENEQETYENIEQLNDSSPRSCDNGNTVVPSKSRLQRIIDEFVSTEETYVQVLHIIDQEFQQVLLLRNQKEELVPNEMIPIIFSNIHTLYELHKNNLLPNLKRCTIPTNSNPDCRIGYVFKRIAPFLKLYSEYLCNFTRANNTLESCKRERPKFAKFIQDIEKRPTCNNLGLQHHMLTTVQRIPRYELLLKDYIKHLKGGSVDMEDATKALDLVTKAAQHSNEIMKMMERQNKLLEISRNLACGTDVLSPTRQLVKEGKMFILSKRDEKQKERYFFLFNDILLICKINAFSLKPSYKVTVKLDLNGMEVIPAGSLSNTFYIMNKEHVIEVCPSSTEEKQAWQHALANAINRFTATNSSRSETDGTTGASLTRNARKGVTAPLWIKDQQAPNCMICNNEFNSIINRRHHCRACGSVVCNSCSTHKMPLEYKEFKECRVCDACFHKMNSVSQILEMKCDEPCSMSGFLHESCDGESWLQRWFALRNHILFSFNSRTEESTTTCVVLTGYKVNRLVDEDCRTTFVLSNRKLKRNIYLRADHADESLRWLEALEQQLVRKDTLAPTSPDTPATRTHQSLLAERLMTLVATESDA